MKRHLACECGFSVSASDLTDLVEAAKHHALRAHQMVLSGEQLAALAEELDDVASVEPARAARTPHGDSPSGG